MSFAKGARSTCVLLEGIDESPAANSTSEAPRAAARVVQGDARLHLCCNAWEAASRRCTGLAAFQVQVQYRGGLYERSFHTSHPGNARTSTRC